MDFAKIPRAAYRTTLALSQMFWLAYPPLVECNICGWRGRHFVSDNWQEHINCPKCQGSIRHRLLVAALSMLPEFSFARLVDDKRLLHFAPEPVLGRLLKTHAATYVTADLAAGAAALTLDLSHMPQVADASFDLVLACDVLEHVPDYRRALAEVHRVLAPGGYGIFTVPQKDHLAATFEDPNLASAAERVKHYGQGDHLRIFGDDFAAIVAGHGFEVTAVNESYFPPALVAKHVLFPPRLSPHPLATNYRKIFFCRKI